MLGSIIGTETENSLKQALSFLLLESCPRDKGNKSGIEVRIWVTIRPVALLTGKELESRLGGAASESEPYTTFKGNKIKLYA